MRHSILAGIVVLCVAGAPSGMAVGASDPPVRQAGGSPQHFAITLHLSLTPVSDLKRYERQFPGWVVYQTRATVAGTEAYVVRIGFFNDIAEASAVRRRVRKHYPDAWTTAVKNDEYVTAVAAQLLGPSGAAGDGLDLSGDLEGDAPPALRVLPQPVAPTANIFAIELHAYREHPDAMPAGIPARYQGYHLYLTKPTSTDRAYRLHLGFFANRHEARQAREALLAHYPSARIVEVSAHDRIETFVPAEKKMAASADAAMPKAPPTAAAPPTPPVPAAAAVSGAAGVATAAVAASIPGADTRPAPPALTSATPARRVAPAAESTAVDREAAALLAQAREALTAGNNAKAIQLLDQLLRRPPSAASREAQELIGVARERAGETARAKTEYELYLKLYPEGEGTDRVRQRLANLDVPAVQAGTPLKRERPTQTLFYGSLSQYYYNGNAKIETKPFDLNGNPLDKTTLSIDDQSALITNVDLNARMRSDRFDQRIVVRNTNTANFLEGQDNDNRLYAAYYDFRDKQLDLGARLGRQPGNTAGVLLPFDGGLLSYGITPRWHANMRAGKLVDYYSDYDKNFQGLSLDMGPFAERWTGSIYILQQEVDGIADREAVGTEIRYLDPRRSLLGLVDYDTLYDVLNVATLQGTWQTDSKLTFNMLLDQRKSPPMMATNALIGETVTSIKQLLQTYSEDEIRELAKARTAEVKMYQLGAAYPIASNWQLSGDVLLTNISGTKTVGGVAGLPETGDQYTYSITATGTGVFSRRDSLTARASYIDAETFEGKALSLFQRSLLGQHWTLDLTVAYYEQDDNFGVHLERTTPTLKLGYLLKPNLIFEIEYGVETTRTDSELRTENTTRQFGSIGYRWDF